MSTQNGDIMNKILWVEDEYKSFRAFSFAIQESFKIIRAHDYSEALEKLGEESFDLFIVDIIIPGGGISTTLEELLEKRDEKYFGLKFINYLRKNNYKQKIIALTVVREQSFIDSLNEIDETVEIIWKYDSDGESLLETVKNVIHKV